MTPFFRKKYLFLFWDDDATVGTLVIQSIELIIPQCDAGHVIYGEAAIKTEGQVVKCPAVISLINRK